MPTNCGSNNAYSYFCVFTLSSFGYRDIELGAGGTSLTGPSCLVIECAFSENTFVMCDIVVAPLTLSIRLRCEPCSPFEFQLFHCHQALAWNIHNARPLHYITLWWQQCNSHYIDMFTRQHNIQWNCLKGGIRWVYCLSAEWSFDVNFDICDFCGIYNISMFWIHSMHLAFLMKWCSHRVNISHLSNALIKWRETKQIIALCV